MRTYRGKLTVEQIAQGIEVCLDNIEKLVEDAHVLLEANRPPSASFALLCADQELGKVYVLQLMAMCLLKDQAEWRLWWRRFRGHEAKTALANVFDILELDESRFSSVIEVVEKDWLPSARDLESLRQLCLYVDYSATENRWLSPREISMEVAEPLMRKVMQRLRRVLEARQLGLLSVKALRIQQEELSSVMAEVVHLEDAGALRTKPLRDKLLNAWRRCWRRLILEGAVTLSNDYLIMGIPWREYIEEKCQ